MSKLLSVVNSPWAITPDMLDTITAIYAQRLNGQLVDIQQAEAKLGRPMANETKRYDVINGVAVLPIHGVVAKRMNLFSAISGGVSTELVKRDYQQALDDSEVKAIVLDIDSPGGAVDGTDELAEFIYSQRGKKRTVAMANGLMASAGYWIGSAADEVVVASSTTNVGSIGVVVQHVDYSESDKQQGVTRSEIYAGKYKRIASDTKPLDEPGRAYLQERVDYLYGVFLSAVSKHLGKSVADVLPMAEGRLFIGEQAINAGLATRQIPLDDLILELADGNSMSASTHRAPAQIKSETHTMEISKDMIQQDHADIANDFREEGAAAERQRILDVQSQTMPGHEELVNTLMFDGKTTGPEAAVQILQAEKAQKQKLAADMADDAPAPVSPAPVVTGEDMAADVPDNANDLAKAAKKICAVAEARGETISAADAVKQAKKEMNNG